MKYLNYKMYLLQNIYESERMVCHAAEAILFYPDILNYYFQFEARVFDFNDGHTATVWTELSFHSFAKRDRNRNRGNSSTKS